MNCYKCSTPIPDDSRFCSACGADVSGESHAGRSQTLAVEGDPDLLVKLQAELSGEYLLERELGRGGMAVVYLGRDAHLGRKVAVKVLPPELTFGGGSMIERFKREAQTAAKLDHPNIIPVYRVSTGGKLFWYVMKFLDGEPLDRILEREGQLSIERTVDIVSQVAGALEYAHQNHVVHRDVKPANVVVDKKGWVTVTDFGIAKALDANTLTASGSIIGTPYYMSPEQCTGKRVGPAADQYSLAVMTYQMLGGHLPFSGESAVEIVHKHVADPVPPLKVLRPQLPERVTRIVERSLAKSPEERFVSVADYGRALKAAAQGLKVNVPPPGRPGSPQRLSKTAAVSPVPGALRTARSSWRDRKGLFLGLGGAAVVAIAAGAVFLVERGATPVGGGRDTTGVRRDSSPAMAVHAPVAPAVPAADTGGPRPSQLATGPVGHDSAAVDTTSRTANPAGQAAPPANPRTRRRPRPSTIAPSEASAEVGTPAVSAPQAPAAPSIGYLSVGTQPRSTIYVNGQPAPRFPLVNFQVQAGTVRLRFQVPDSSGLWWAQDREVTVNAGDTVRLGFIRLVKP